MAIASHDAIYEWLTEVQEHIGERCIATAQELETLYLAQSGANADNAPGRAKKISEGLRKLGYSLANNGIPVKVQGVVKRYWVIVATGKTWDSAQVQEHVNSVNLLPKGKIG